MTRLRFVANLRAGSVENFDQVGFQPAAWLLSTHRLDPAMATLATEERARGIPLFADNGTKDLIDTIVDRFAGSAEPLQRRIRKLRHNIGPNRRIPTASEVPAPLAGDASELAHEVVDAAETLARTQPLQTTLDAQLSMKPTHMIAKEDFATACLLALGLEREITRWRPSYFDRRNERSLDWWAEVNNDPRTENITVYVTLSATDYNTAFRAGRLAAAANARHVALGFAGINSDPTWADSFLYGGRHQLPAPAPRRYTRTVGIVAGIAAGIQEAGGTLDSFHALGLGAAAQFPVLAAALPAGTTTTTDATSPIHDAVRDLVAYDPDARGDRVTVLEAVQRILTGGAWTCPGPFCADIRSRLGHDPEAARKWWTDNAKPPITRDVVEPPHPIVAALPLFGAGRNGTTADANEARIGHNHWALDFLTERVPEGSERDWGLQELNALTDDASITIRFGVAGALHMLNKIHED